MATSYVHPRYVRPRINTRKLMQRFIQYSILSAIVVVVLVPIVILIFGALKTRGEFMTRPYDVPIPPRWENVTQILSQPEFWNMLRNSLIVMVATTSIVVLVCSLAAFVFARMEFRTKGFLFNLFTLGLMFPINIAILPVYFVLRQIDMLDKLSGVIIVQIAFQLSGNVMILRGFFTSIPTELQSVFSGGSCYRWLSRLWRPWRL
jgi:raffinose/stachyose/melibiose transport system permease protein